MSTSQQRWVVYVWFKQVWALHHHYPTELAAKNAMKALVAKGKRAFIGPEVS